MDMSLNFYSHSGFRTDADISSSSGQAATRERELQQWQPDSAPTSTAASLAALQGDEATFGPPGGYSGQPWDQFEVNEQLFGVTTNFDEDAYTTKLDRNAPGFKERERKAQQLANEIMSVRTVSLPASIAACSSPMIQGTTSNPHIAEERAMNGTENGIGEEEKYDNCHVFGCFC
jgi:PAB1-binding protein PBP1